MKLGAKNSSIRERPQLKRVALSLLLILALVAWRLPGLSHAQGGVTQATWSGFIPGAIVDSGATGMEVVLPKNHTLTRFSVVAEKGSECTTYPTVGFKDMTTGTILTQLTVDGYNDSGPLSITMTGGHKFAFQVVGQAHCSAPYPGAADFTVIYQ